MLKGTHKGDGPDLVLDFSPKGGPSGLEALWIPEESKIKFSDGNAWARIDSRTAPDGPNFGPRLVPEPFEGVPTMQGVFADAQHFDASASSLAG